MNIQRNITQIKASLPEGVTLVAVSKFHPMEALTEAYEAGQRIFGESRAQELKAKQAVLPKDIEWHFIGPLQSNKVKDIAAYIHTIHSIDSLKLVQEVNKQALRHNRTIRVLLEIHVATEDSKHGFSPEEVLAFLANEEWKTFSNIRITGLMGMATFTDDEELVRSEFRQLKELFDSIRATWFPDDPEFSVLSMGMSDDYPVALEEGSTMIRVGSKIFGEREY
ncbi:MAG: YggS family pyridoxal phosphate-dependent enzyme [Tannerellaceae bacterium]|nr:YggS family pyridoxal phosphate-dependent enzyme [Tannerellaceae bacterium]